jgi:hypothetical protein
MKDLEAGANPGNAPAVVELGKLSKAALLPPPPVSAAAASAAVSVADASSMLVPPAVASARADAKRSKSAAAAANGDGDAVDAAGDLDDGGAEGEAEESMGDRARRMGGAGAAASLGLEAPKADSVAVLLQQGLQVICSPTCILTPQVPLLLPHTLRCRLVTTRWSNRLRHCEHALRSACLTRRCSAWT